jgi:hypothetical protein
MYSEIVWLGAGWTAPTRANANRITGLPNSYIAVTMEICTEVPSAATRDALRKIGQWRDT